MAYTTIDNPGSFFNTVLYTGTGSDNNAITGVGFSPDWVWLKKRSATGGHFIQDRVRGATKSIYSDGNYAEDTVTTAHKSFDSDGFTLGTNSNVNVSSGTHVSWNWLAGGSASSNSDGSITSNVSANTTAGFSIVSYTGTGSNATVGHGLGELVKWILIKNRDQADNWAVGHTSIGFSNHLQLNVTNGSTGAAAVFNSTAPTSTVFSIGTNHKTNASSEDYIAYCFAEKKGYSKFGSYIGNGNADGTFVYTGFRPAWFILKSTSGEAWNIYDNKRLGFNDRNDQLLANTTGAEGDTSAWRIDILSNGVKIRGSDSGVNNSGTTYIYMAFAESPFVTSTGIPNNAR